MEKSWPSFPGVFPDRKPVEKNTPGGTCPCCGQNFHDSMIHREVLAAGRVLVVEVKHSADSVHIEQPISIFEHVLVHGLVHELKSII
eukprot:5868182-Karenia_brevis.AAC.1